MSRPNHVLVDARPATIGVRGPDDIVAALRQLLPTTVASNPAEWIDVTRTEHGQFHVGWASGGHLSPNIASVGEAVVSCLNWLHVELAPSVLHLHAGAVRTDTATIVISGPSLAGKSTLVAACVERGLGYLSDECVDLAADGSVTTWNKPLGLRSGGRELLGNSDRPGPGRHFLPLQSAASSASHTAIVLLDIDCAPSLERVRPADAVHALVVESLDFGRRPGDLLRLAGLVARSSTYRLGRADPERMVDLIGEVAPPVHPVDFHAIASSTDSVRGPLRWARDTELVVIDGTLLAFNRTSRGIVTLDGSFGGLVDQLGSGTSPEQLRLHGVDPRLIVRLCDVGVVAESA